MRGSLAHRLMQLPQNTLVTSVGQCLAFAGQPFVVVHEAAAGLNVGPDPQPGGCRCAGQPFVVIDEAAAAFKFVRAFSPEAVAALVSPSLWFTPMPPAFTLVRTL